VRYPKEAKKHKVEGRVIITFVVEGDGSISNVEPVQSFVHFVNKEKALKATGMTEEEMTNHFGNLFQDEARRVLNSMPKWKPGVQFGRPVRVKYTMPLNFAQP
jgi:TonB family protein